KVNGERPAQGQVLVEHILKLTQGMDTKVFFFNYSWIYEIYTLVTAGGADFEDVATRESEDPGSAKNGGRLNWFGSGQMVPEFEQTAFSLADGAISEPFATAYGYHIIKRLEGKGIDPYETMHPMLKKVISQDERGDLPRKRRIEQLSRKYGVQRDQAASDAGKKEIAANRGLDSALTAKYLASETPMAKIGKQPLMLSEVMAEMGNPFIGTGEQQAGQFQGLVNRAVENAVLEAAREDLAREEPQYGNLLNEYRDGMLLFEISDRNVWSKAKEDKEGLEKYFEANRAKYAWDKPRLKSYVVFATSDSVCSAAKAYLESNTVPNDSIGLVLRREFGNNVKVERVLAAKGENPITDFIAFGGEKPEPKGRWAFYFPYQNRVILQPEDAGDVRGAVTGDYQNYLEEKWVASLREKYPAKINQKVLKQARKNQEAAAGK
ncbi:MAG: peptidyl-prolyl cis-trans isomerase, partial [Muribaculaceae bacterium]|nr:peptidyl-prolyl cis-trans isomerase [Muribaculaceae bacterium]